MVIIRFKPIDEWADARVRQQYLSSDEAVDETIVANDYTFTSTGRQFG